MQIVRCITLINSSCLTVAYFRDGRFEQTREIQICPRHTQLWHNCKAIGGKNLVKTSIALVAIIFPEGPPKFTLPCPQKGQTTAPYYWCWMVMLFMYLYGEVTKKVGFVSADSWRVWKSTASLDSVDRTSVSQIQFSFPHENNTLIYVRLLRFSHNIIILPWIPKKRTNQQLLLTHISSQMWNS